MIIVLAGSGCLLCGSLSGGRAGEPQSLTIEDQRAALRHFIAAVTRAIGIAELSSQALQKFRREGLSAMLTSLVIIGEEPRCRD